MEIFEFKEKRGKRVYLGLITSINREMEYLASNVVTSNKYTFYTIGDLEGNFDLDKLRDGKYKLIIEEI